MPRATIRIETDDPDDMAAGERWLAENRGRLSFLSDNYGCVCHTLLYDVEGPAEVIDTIPPTLRARANQLPSGHLLGGGGSVAPPDGGSP